MADAFYSVDGDRVVPSELTRGPWDPNSQHAGPPSALLARALELCEPRAGMRIGRVTVEILAPLPIAPMTLSAQVVRPGRSVEMVESVLEGRNAASSPGRAAGGSPRPTSRRTGSRRSRRLVVTAARRSSSSRPGEAVGWHTAMEIVFARGRFLEPGPATVWMRPRVALVEGDEISPLQRVMLAADGGNGVSAPLDWSSFIFINTDLTVHLLRPPEGEWVCLDSVTHVDGIGMTDTALWDERGRIGRAAQTLLVRARP